MLRSVQYLVTWGMYPVGGDGAEKWAAGQRERGGVGLLYCTCPYTRWKYCAWIFACRREAGCTGKSPHSAEEHLLTWPQNPLTISVRVGASWVKSSVEVSENQSNNTAECHHRGRMDSDRGEGFNTPQPKSSPGPPGAWARVLSYPRTRSGGEGVHDKGIEREARRVCRGAGTNALEGTIIYRWRYLTTW